MHNLALALKHAGHNISGSDDEIFEPSKSRLKNEGLLPEKFGWFPDKLNDEIDIVILGMHAKGDNPELIEARNLGLKIMSYPEFIYSQSVNKKRIVIGGSHGKTTITAMVLHVLGDLNFDFDYLVGSKLENFDVMVKLSDAPLIVLEGDEYLSSPIDLRPKFHWYKPHIAVLTGIAWDHINVFPTFENYKSQFDTFINLMEDDGKLFYCKNDIELSNLVENNSNKIDKTPYELPEYEIYKGVSSYVYNDKKYALKVFGQHNLLNLNAAMKICGELGITPEQFLNSISSFKGASNRLELVASNSNSFVFKDFAHAPSKLKATVNAVRQQFPDKTLVAAFELHTYSSLNPEFIVQYKSCLDEADKAFVYYNEHALKIKRMENLDKEMVHSAFGRKDLLVLNDSEELKLKLKQSSSDNVVYLFMSSGNFNGINFVEFSKELI